MKLSLIVEGETKIALVRRELCTLLGSHFLHLRINDREPVRKTILVKSSW